MNSAATVTRRDGHTRDAPFFRPCLPPPHPPAMGHFFERTRFAVYVLVPILSVVIFSNPAVYEHAIRSNAYVVYKYNPSDSPLYHARNKAARIDAVPARPAPVVD
jgi:hypothetical protein